MPPRVNPDAKRREVVAQAADLFDRSGYHTTNVAAVAEAAGMRKPTLYHYFSGKDEILFWIHEEFIDLLIEKQRERAGSSAGEALHAIMGDVLDLMRTHRGHVRVFFEHHRELSAGDQETIGSKRDTYRQLVEDVVVQGDRKRRVPPRRPPPDDARCLRDVQLGLPVVPGRGAARQRRDRDVLLRPAAQRTTREVARWLRCARRRST